MITLTDISKKVGYRILFENVNISFNEGKRYAITGPNGSGKSTLMKMLMGIEEPTSGTISLPKKVGFLKQNIEVFQDEVVLNAVIMGNKRLWDAFKKRDELYDQEMTDEIGILLGELEEIISEENGYSAEAEAESLLIGMGISKSLHVKKIHEIPIDLQFRVLLCQALFGDPQALLLDEPTNHLDMESIGWLEEFLLNYRGTLLVISHDRHFLNKISTDIADIDYETVIVYPGNYDQMVLTKTNARDQAELANETKQKKIKQLQEFIARFGAGTRASQAKSRMNQMDNIQLTELKKSNIQRPYICFYPPEKPSGQLVLKGKDISKSYGNVSVIPKISFQFLKGDKVGVIGNNGRGKTTFLKMLAGVLAPENGNLELGHNVQIGYFPQNHSDIIDKKSGDTAFSWLKKQKSQVKDQEVRSVLGKMLFSGDEAFKNVSQLSGGETARLILAGMMLCNYNCLIMDEPNNHLDLESVSALSQAFHNFQGTLIFASHDRGLLDEVATKIIAFEADGIKFFQGTLEEYLKP